MTKKLDTAEVLQGVYESIAKVAEANQLDITESEFTIVQPLEDGNAITVKVGDNDEGERGINVEVNDSVFVLEPLEGTLDVFVSEDDDDEDEE